MTDNDLELDDLQAEVAELESEIDDLTAALSAFEELGLAMLATFDETHTVMASQLARLRELVDAE